MIEIQVNGLVKSFDSVFNCVSFIPSIAQI